MTKLWRTLRDMYRAVRYFGNEELEVLKQDVLQLQTQVEQLKELRNKRMKFEEQMTLAQVRASIEKLQGHNLADQQQQAAMKHAVDMKEAELLSRLESGMKEQMQQRVSAVLGKLDLNSLLHDPTVNVEQAVKDSIHRMEADSAAQKQLHAHPDAAGTSASQEMQSNPGSHPSQKDH